MMKYFGLSLPCPEWNEVEERVNRETNTSGVARLWPRALNGEQVKANCMRISTQTGELSRRVNFEGGNDAA